MQKLYPFRCLLCKINNMKSENKSKRITLAFSLLMLFMLIIFPVLINAQVLVKGKVINKNGKAIPYANIYLKKSQNGTITDTLGYFKLELPSAIHDTLVVSCVGYNSYVKPLITKGKVTNLKIVLKESESNLSQVVITAGMFEANNKSAVAVLKPMDIETTASSEGDITGAIQTFPGVQRNGGDQTGLMVRGGDVSESKILIDGTTVQNAFYSNVPGVSQRSRFDPFQFKGISFSSGGYSARYGQALSAILVLNTKDLPEKSNISAELKMSGASLSGSKLIDNNAIEFSGSYSNLSPFLATNKSNIKFSRIPVGEDFSTRYISRLKDNKGIFKMGFIQSGSSSGTIIPDPANPGSLLDYKLKNTNSLFNTSFNYWASTNLKFFTAFSYSNNADNIYLDSVNLYRTDSHFEGRAEVRYETSSRFNVLAGLDLQQISYFQKYDSISGRFNEMLDAAYIQGEYKPFSWFAIKPGVRFEYSNLINSGYIAPRLAFAFHTGQGSQISFAGGLYYETAPAKYFLQGYRPGFQHALHCILDYQIMKNDRTFRIEGYYKNYADLIREKGVPYTPDQYHTDFGKVDNTGYGYARGVDVFWRDKKSIKNFDYWISYSYIDTKRLYQNYIALATPDYVSTNNLNIVAKYLFEQLQTNISATYNYSSGRPYYNPSASKFLSNLAPGYQNLAVTLSYLFSVKNAFCVFYISADNILNHKNILGYRYSSSGAERYPILPPMYRSVYIGFKLSLTKFTQDEL